jgi:calcineurin-like phosphoesterase family protein
MANTKVMNINPTKTKYKYIHFVKNKHDIWECRNNKSKDVLGGVGYFPKWKQHVFFTSPENESIFNITCWEDVHHFLAQLEDRKVILSSTPLMDENELYKKYKELEADNLRLRQLLWLRHNPEHSNALYGDDGELQCSVCMIDFKRMSVSDIIKKLTENNLKDL